MSQDNRQDFETALPRGRSKNYWRVTCHLVRRSLTAPHLGIKVTLVEPGGYATDWGGSSAVQADPNPVYDGVRDGLAAFMETVDFGDPAAAGRAMLEVVDSDNPPLRVFFGTQGNEMLPQVYADRLKTWADWGDLAVRAQGGQAA
jgi:hypothetical protein